MKTMKELKRLGLTESKSIGYEKDENGKEIPSKPKNIYYWIKSVAIAGETKNTVFMNSPKNPIWSTGYFFDIGDEEGMKKYRKRAEERFDVEFESRYNNLNKDREKRDNVDRQVSIESM